MRPKNSKKPFFASFLEKQIKNPEKVNGGLEITTALEDSITIPTKDTITSAILDNVTKPGFDNVTMKYPSDGDDSVV